MVETIKMPLVLGPEQTCSEHVELMHEQMRKSHRVTCLWDLFVGLSGPVIACRSASIWHLAS